MNKTEASQPAPISGIKAPVPFTKMQGLGNDFVFIDEHELQSVVQGGAPVPYGELARRLCDRHYGIGADGLIIVREPTRDDCDIAWHYLNSDGSISLMCGNGLRCLALWAWEHRWVTRRDFIVQTDVGAVPVSVRGEDAITTTLGEPILTSSAIPVGGPIREKVVAEPVELGGKSYAVTCVSMGNPHCVIFDSGITDAEAARVAPSIQADKFFPESVNVEFVKLNSRTQADVFVWERGCGPTLACASGAAAVLVAGVLEKRLDRTANIRLPGGTLVVAWDEKTNRVSITGPARITYKGHFDANVYLYDEARE